MHGGGRDAREETTASGAPISSPILLQQLDPRPSDGEQHTSRVISARGPTALAASNRRMGAARLVAHEATLGVHPPPIAVAASQDEHFLHTQVAVRRVAVPRLHADQDSRVHGRPRYRAGPLKVLAARMQGDQRDPRHARSTPGKPIGVDLSPQARYLHRRGPYLHRRGPLHRRDPRPECAQTPGRRWEGLVSRSWETHAEVTQKALHFRTQTRHDQVCALESPRVRESAMSSAGRCRTLRAVPAPGKPGGYSSLPRAGNFGCRPTFFSCVLVSPASWTPLLRHAVAHTSRTRWCGASDRSRQGSKRDRARSKRDRAPSGTVGAVQPPGSQQSGVQFRA